VLIADESDCDENDAANIDEHNTRSNEFDHTRHG
jgi:hypothetical protein